jgi:hypothetical protein
VGTRENAKDGGPRKQLKQRAGQTSRSATLARSKTAEDGPCPYGARFPDSLKMVPQPSLHALLAPNSVVP